jgi:hypothetical protein
MKMNRNNKRWMAMTVVLAALFGAAAAWAQETGTGPQEGADPQAVALVVSYARSQEEIGPQEQAMLREQVALMLKAMEAMGYSRRVAVRAALEGVREAMAELRTRLRSGQPGHFGEQLGDLLRIRLQEQIRLSACDQARDQLREQDRERLRQQPDGLVPGSPGGYGAPGGGGRH